MNRLRGTQTDRQADREIDTDRQRDTDRHTHTHTDRQTDTHTHVFLASFILNILKVKDFEIKQKDTRGRRPMGCLCGDSAFTLCFLFHQVKKMAPHRRVMLDLFYQGRKRERDVSDPYCEEELAVYLVQLLTFCCEWFSLTCLSVCSGCGSGLVRRRSQIWLSSRRKEQKCVSVSVIVCVSVSVIVCVVCVRVLLYYNVHAANEAF